MKRATGRVVCGVLALALTSAAPTANEKADVTLKTVHYAELGRIVRDLKGKVVVVDFWAHY
jgi:hypothetical protein